MSGTNRPVLLLASASPRRRELLNQIGIAHLAKPVDVDESVRLGETAEDYVLRLALEKARAGIRQYGSDLPTMGSDTALSVDGDILGKPENQSHFFDTLRRLSGRTHQVLTSVALASPEQEGVRLSVNQVTFRRITDLEIRDYWASGEPTDKAGGYAIQGLGSVFVSHLEGSFSGVMGLPLFETAELLEEFGLPALKHRA